VRAAAAALVRAAGPAPCDEASAARLAPMLREVGRIAALGPEAPLDAVVAAAHRAVHAYRPYCADPSTGRPGDGVLFVAWSRLHETLHRFEDG
jgi:hypothetical protein